MREFHGSASAFVAATPETVFDVITDIERLSDWNQAIESVPERPELLDVGAQWVVVTHRPHRRRRNSRSSVEELDHHRRRFTYRTRTDDSNPSFVIWMWDVVAVGGGALVTVTWDAHLRTLVRRLIGARLRRQALEREVAASLSCLKPTTTHRRVS
jgi:uncharacterized protein YndB with AHSA1/START domain